MKFKITIETEEGTKIENLQLGQEVDLTIGNKDILISILEINK